MKKILHITLLAVLICAIAIPAVAGLKLDKNNYQLLSNETLISNDEEIYLGKIVADSGGDFEIFIEEDLVIHFQHDEGVKNILITADWVVTEEADNDNVGWEKWRFILQMKYPEQGHPDKITKY